MLFACELVSYDKMADCSARRELYRMHSATSGFGTASADGLSMGIELTRLEVFFFCEESPPSCLSPWLVAGESNSL